MAYTPPAKETVIVVGGLGTMADAIPLAGGGATKTVWDANNPGDFIGANGGPITSNNNAAFDYGNKTISIAGIGAGVTAGTLCYCNDGAAEASFFTGWYEVTGVAAGVLTFANISLSGIDTDQANGVTCEVGGAFGKAVTGGVDEAGLANALDASISNAIAYNRYIYVNGDTSMAAGTITIEKTVDVDTGTGAINTRLIIKGANSNCVVDGTRPIITTVASLATGLLAFDDNSDFTQWWYIDFDAGGAGKADYCIYNPATDVSTTTHFFFDCIIRRALDVRGISIESPYWGIIKCQIYGNGAGIFSDHGNNLFVGNSIHDNNGIGIQLSSSTNVIVGNLIYDNTGIGIDTDTISDFAYIMSNTIFGNGGDGIRLVGAADTCVVINNTSCGNGGFGYNLDDRGNVRVFGYNHSCDGTTTDNDNVSGHCNLMTDPTSDAEWADFFDGNNQFGNPDFANIGDGAEDFTPTAGSPLINNAVDPGTA